MPHTMLMLLAALILLIVLRLTISDAARATRLFLILWLLVSTGNLLVGVLHAGYSWTVEAGVWLIVFGVPTAVAVLTGRPRPDGRA